MGLEPRKSDSDAASPDLDARFGLTPRSLTRTPIARRALDRANARACLEPRIAGLSVLRMRMLCSILPIVLALLGCANENARAQRSSLKIEVPNLSEGDTMPERFTCEGNDASPPLSFSGVPESARSLALIVDDPDAPRGTFTHWLVYDIAPDERGLEENQARTERLENGALQGQNDFETLGWHGPCPPPGPAHRYRFTLHAIDRMLRLAPGADRRALDRAMSGKSIARATFTARFGR